MRDAANTVTIGDNTWSFLNYDSWANQIFSGTVTGGGNLIKSGPGSTLTLSGSFAYTGSTTVTAGTLVLNMNAGGSLTPSSAVALSNGNLNFVGVDARVGTEQLEHEWQGGHLDWHGRWWVGHR